MNLEEVIIPNESSFERTLERIKSGGAEKMHVLTDFDRTLTKEYVDGQRVMSMIAILRNKGVLGEEYSKKAHELFERYHPFETSSEISLEEKKSKMHEWWKKHFELLLSYNLNMRHIEMAANDESIRLREGVKDFFRVLSKYEIPVVILSSSGLGKEAISMILSKYGILSDNVKIVSNSFKWDKNGNAVGIDEPIIHVFNKSEVVLKDYPFYGLIKERKNVLLMGDSLGDLGMVEGFEYDTLLKVGFFNKKDDSGLEGYTNNFDVIIKGDDGLGFVNHLLKDVL